MERSKHNILVSEGAQQFAKEHGIYVLNNELLQTESSTKAFKVFAIITAPHIVPHIVIYHQRLF
jgi:isoaspartyl peptidase/L-asparaginase-like protein (Ntn-hydrolase superfamily)